MIRKNPMRFVALVAGTMVVSSILFEFVRMTPDFRLIVEPWSIRGYELTQGAVVAALGVGVTVLAVLAASSRGSNVFNASVGFGAWLAAVLITQFADPPPVSISVPPFIAIVVTALLSFILARTVMALARDRIPVRGSVATAGVFAAIFLIAYLAVVNPNFVDPNRTDVDLSVLVAVGFGITALASVISPPRELAVPRIAINSAFVSWIVIATLSGGLRARLVESQLEEMGVSATYRDTQITSGLMIAFAGMIIMFLACVAIWARKRDRLQALARARRQQEAAAQSAAEQAQTSG